MGWKTFKEKFKVEHTVQVTEKGLCIGSPYIHDLAVVNIETGDIKAKEYWEDFLKRDYPQLLEASKDEILKAIQEDDVFEKSITIFTFDGGEILKKEAEKFGYPNITHDGCLMYENTFFKTEKEAVKKAISEISHELEFYSESIKEKEAEISRLCQKLDNCKLTRDELKQKEALL